MILFYWLIVIMPLEDHPIWGHHLGSLTVVKYVGLACVAYALFHLSVRKRVPPLWGTPQALAFLIFLFPTFLSYWLMGPKFSFRSSEFISYLSMTFLFFVVLSVVDTVERLRWTLLTAVAAMGLASLYVTREWMKDPLWRPGSVTGDANYFALNAVLVLPVAFLLALRSRVLWERVFGLGCMVATIASAMLGASRGGLFALGAAFLCLVWHSPRRLRNSIIIFILIVPPLVLLPSSPLRRLIHPQWSDLTGEQDRRIAWRAGLRMIERHPLTGIGLGEFKPQMPYYADPGVGFTSIAHNTYIEVAAETGLPAFFVFMALLFFTYRGLSRVRRETSESGPPLVHLAASSIQAGFLGYLVGAFFLSAEYEKLFWLWVFLSMALPSLVPEPVGERRTESRYAARPAWTVARPDLWRPQPGRSGRLSDAPSSRYRPSPAQAAKLTKYGGGHRGRP